MTIVKTFSLLAAALFVAAASLPLLSQAAMIVA